MFYDCSSLISLDLSNFDTSNVESMDNMFDGCISLEYIDLRSFSESKLIKDSSRFIFNNYLSFQKKINEYDYCTESYFDKFEYNGKCYDNCTNGFYMENNISKCKCEIDNCLSCSNISLSKELCITCNNEYKYYPMENDPLNLGKFMKCYENIKGYYLDHVNYIFKKCYYTCKTCEIQGNSIDHNCLICNDNFPKKINNNNYLNCYNNSNYDEYLNIPSDSNITANEINQKIYERIINIFNENFEDLIGEEKIIEGKDDFFYQLSTTNDEANNLEGNNNKINKFSKIDLGQCEDILKEKNNIDKNSSLLMLKYEKLSNISYERNMQFEIYDPMNKTRLDLSVCNNISIDIYVPVILSDKFLGLYI